MYEQELVWHIPAKHTHTANFMNIYCSDNTTFICWLTSALASISTRTTSTFPEKEAITSGVIPSCVDNDSKQCTSTSTHIQCTLLWGHRSCMKLAVHPPYACHPMHLYRPRQYFFSCILEVADGLAKWREGGMQRGRVEGTEEGGEMHMCTCMCGMCSILSRCTFVWGWGEGERKFK